MQQLTHEAYINHVRDLVVPLIGHEQLAAKARQAKLVYGVGKANIRGITYYNAWANHMGEDKAAFVEITAKGEESPCQLAGTTIHELGHVLAGYGQGHNVVWKQACHVLGLRCIKAAGTRYLFANFAPAIRDSIYSAARKLEGSKPLFNELRGFTVAPCPMGIGTRGGMSRGVGSGSRLRLWQCQCPKPVKVRVALDNFDATCNKCGKLFQQPL